MIGFYITLCLSFADESHRGWNVGDKHIRHVSLYPWGLLASDRMHCIFSDSNAFKASKLMLRVADDGPHKVGVNS